MLTDQAVPLQIHCVVREHDGGIGAGWEDVLDKTRTVTQSGNYTVSDSNSEGDVAIHFNVDSGTGNGQTCDTLEGEPPPPTPPAKRYDAVFLPGTDSQNVSWGLDWNLLMTHWSLNAIGGRRMHDIESYVEGGVRRYNAVFRAGGGDVLWAGVSWSSMMDKRTELAAQGVYLADLESYLEGGTRVYTGVFRPGTGATVVKEASWQGFLNSTTTASNLGYRIVDLESYVISNGNRVYTAVYHKGSGGQYIYDGMTYDAFEGLIYEEADRGYFPILTLTRVTSGVRIYGAVFRPASAGTVEVGRSESYMYSRIAALKQAGWRLVQMNVH
jgi:hypothetical protein